MKNQKKGDFKVVFELKKEKKPKGKKIQNECFLERKKGNCLKEHQGPRGIFVIY